MSTSSASYSLLLRVVLLTDDQLLDSELLHGVDGGGFVGLWVSCLHGIVRILFCNPILLVRVDIHQNFQLLHVHL
jgi:hypothetical protein